MTKKNDLPFADVLRDLLDNDEITIRLLPRLSDLPEADFDLFMARWTQTAVERRRAIARHLANLSEDNFAVDFAPVFRFFFSDEDPQVRIAALDGIWDADTPSLVPPIVSLLRDDPDASVQKAAAGALAHYVLLAEWGQVSSKAADTAVATLLEIYDDPQTAVELRAAVLEAVSPASDARIPVLIEEAYESDSRLLQQSAIFAMGGTADERWLPILREEMESSLDVFRTEAARAVGSIGDPGMVGELANLIVDEDEETALAAVWALGEIGGETAVDILNGIAQDEELEHLHDAAADALEEADITGGINFTFGGE